MFGIAPSTYLLFTTTFWIARAGEVRLSQGTPCVVGQSCVLRCDLVSGQLTRGFSYAVSDTPVVTCGSDGTCTENIPSDYRYTRSSATTSQLQILKFAAYDAVDWRCYDGVTDPLSVFRVMQNSLPNGPLTWGSTCVSGRASSPASLSCSAPSPGVPPATLAVKDSGNQAVNSSQTGSVTGTVTRGGQASCSVTWPAFPSFPLNINPVLCDVQVVASVTTSVRDVTGGNKVITCQAQGHPDIYTFQPWLQSWGGQEVRRVTGSQQGGQYSLTLTSYQDSGTYTCTVDNGVLDSRGQVIRISANLSVALEAVPVLPLPSDPPIVAGETGDPVRLFRSVFASPVLTSHTWFFNSTDVISLIPGATTNSSRAMVSLPVHGSTVTTEGSVVSLYFTVSEQYSGLYRLQACNTIGCNSANVTLQAASAPFPPESLAAEPNPASVELSWTPGFAGGDFFQWFHVQYRRQDSQEGQWSDVSTADNRSSSDRTPVTVSVQGLQPDTSYVFRVRAQSSRPQWNLSNYTEVSVKTTLAAATVYTGSVLAAAVVVTMVLSSAVTAAVICIALRLRHRAQQERQKASASYQNAAFSRQDVSENVSSASGRAHPGTDNSQHSGPDGAYSVLDPVSRDTPRDPALYQRLAKSGLHGNQQVYSNSTEGQYTSAYELTQ